MSAKASLAPGAKDGAVRIWLKRLGYNFTETQLGEPFAGYPDFKTCVARNRNKVDPYAYCGYIKSRTEDTLNIPSTEHLPNLRTPYEEEFEAVESEKPNIRIFDSPIKIQEALAGQSFNWLGDIGKMKSMEGDGKFLLVVGLHPMITDPFNVGHGAREWTPEQIMKSTYTAIGKTMDINHTIPLNEAYNHQILDGEFNNQTSAAEYVLYEEDPEILQLIRDGYIEAVSMNGRPRKPENMVCDSCGGQECNCRNVPEGVIFGEGDGVGMAYVVTQEGAYYMGQHIPAERPGDWNSSIQIVESNSSKTSSGASESMQRGMSLFPLSRKVVAANINETNPKLLAQLQERVMHFEKYAKTQEDLQSFNDALASGNALGALQIAGGDLYKMSSPNASAQYGSSGASAGPFADNTQGIPGTASYAGSSGATGGKYENLDAAGPQNAPPLKKGVQMEDDLGGGVPSAAGTGIGGGFMPQDRPGDPNVPFKQPKVPLGKKPSDYSVPTGQNRAGSNKQISRERVREAGAATNAGKTTSGSAGATSDYADDQGSPVEAPSPIKKNTIADEGVANQDHTMGIKPTGGDSGNNQMPPRNSVKQGQIAQSHKEVDTDVEDDDSSETHDTEMHDNEDDAAATEGENERMVEINKLRKEMRGMKESMGNISGQMQEIKKLIMTTRSVRETNTASLIEESSPIGAYTMKDVPNIRERLARIGLPESRNA